MKVSYFEPLVETILVHTLKLYTFELLPFIVQYLDQLHIKLALLENVKNHPLS